MPLLDKRLQVEIQSNGCEIPPDQREKLQRLLSNLDERVRDFPNPNLRLNVVYHSNSLVYHVEGALTLPGRRFKASEHDAYLDSALQRAVRNITRETETYIADQDTVAAARRGVSHSEDRIAAEAADAGRLGNAVQAGDYRAFRTALASYEEWLRKRIGRWIERRPDAQGRLGRELRLGDIVEQVYLHAFEGFMRRPTVVPLREWLEGLIDRSISSLLRNPDEEKQAASLARTLRETSPS